MHININYNDYHKRKTKCTYIFIQKDFFFENFSDTKSDTLKKARQFELIFHTLFFWNWYLYTKSIILCVTWRFYIQKYRHFTKNQDNLRCVFISKNPDTFHHAIIMEFLKLAEGGGILYLKNALCITFIYKKTTPIALRFYIQKSRHFRLHFYMQKTMHFALRFISKMD